MILRNLATTAVLLVLLELATAWRAPWSLLSKRPLASSTADDAELIKARELENIVLAKAEAARQAEERAVQKLLQATLGLDRGALATSHDVVRVNAAVNALEATSPCVLRGDALLSALQGTSWRLAYTSSLADTSHSSSPSGSAFHPMKMNKLVDVPGMRPPIGLGSVWQRYHGDGDSIRLEDVVSLRLPALWPLPRLELLTTFSYRLKAAQGCGALNASLHEVFVSQKEEAPQTASPRSARRLTVPASSRVLQCVLGDLKRFEEGASQLRCTSLVLRGPANVLVMSSALGDLRVFVAESDSSPGLPGPGSSSSVDEAARDRSGIHSAPSPQALDNYDSSSDEVEIWVEGVSDWDLDDAAGKR